VLNKGKQNVLGIMVDAIDCEAATDIVLDAARNKRSAAVSALAVHGLMTGVLDRVQKFRLNHFDLVVPDGQPVRWAINWLYSAGLAAPVIGRNLTLRLCAQAAAEGLSVYFYGSTPDTLSSLKRSLEAMFPSLVIAGTTCSKFRALKPNEKLKVVNEICDSGASIVFVGLGCPRQEIFAYEFRGFLQAPIVAVGAAFPFLAGKLPEAPRWMQDRGLEWLFRLGSEPARLWRRYVLLNPAYLALVLLQAFRLSNFSTTGKIPTDEPLYG
jgi:N-acetylglucosaminyldiphosphoundecaprenol N-acetyl-beta-D-mannosaminyltransferase